MGIPQKRRKMGEERADSVAEHVVLRCVVCGEIADGVHFGALVCPACGAFFRRSIANQKVYACSREEECAKLPPLAPSSHSAENSPGRKHSNTAICQFCRFERCLEEGMNADEVQSKRLFGIVRPSKLRFGGPGSAIEELVQIRKDVVEERKKYEAERAQNVNAVRRVISNEWSLFLSHLSVSRIISKIQEEAAESMSQVDPGWWPEWELRRWQAELAEDLFVCSFIFECVVASSSRGGVQIDAMILPNGLRVPLDETHLTTFYSRDDSIADPACFARLSRDFLESVVRGAARSLQAMHIDPQETAWLYALFLSSAARSLGHPCSVRESLLKEARIDDSGAVRLGALLLLLTPLLAAVALFKQFLSLASLNGVTLLSRPDVVKQ